MGEKRRRKRIRIYRKEKTTVKIQVGAVDYRSACL
jgi:hypothetical protein